MAYRVAQYGYILIYHMQFNRPTHNCNKIQQIATKCNVAQRARIILRCFTERRTSNYGVRLVQQTRLTNPWMHLCHIPQCTILLQKCAHVCTFLLQNGALWDFVWCTVWFVRWVYSLLVCVIHDSIWRIYPAAVMRTLRHPAGRHIACKHKHMTALAALYIA